MKVYMNTKFLVNLFSNQSDEEALKEIEKYITSAKSGAEIVIVDIDDAEDAYRDPELLPFFRKIGNKLALFDESILDQCQSADFHNKTKNHLFFLDNQDDLGLEGYGCIVTSSSDFQKIQWLFEANDFRVDSSQTGCSILNKIKHPCNAIIITDNYLLSSERAYKNVLSIFENLMPASLKEGFHFHITIIGNNSKSNKPINEQYDELKIHLENRYPYQVDLTIIKEDHHDRYIFTNYYRIMSPGGFDLFQRGKRISKGQETTLDCKGISHFTLNSSTESIIEKELANCQRINNMEIIKDRLAGDGINRLLNKNEKR